MRTITLQSSNAKSAKREGPSRRLLDAKFQAHKERGQCFCCNEKFIPGHLCESKDMQELRLFIVHPNANESEFFDEISEEGSTTKLQTAIVIVIKEVETVVELSLKSK